MQIILLVIGKTSERWIEDGIKTFEKRLKHYVPFQLKVINDVKTGKRSPEELKQLEGIEILKTIEPSDYVILLDEKGDEHSSRKLSQQLQKWMNASPKRLIFVIGGAFGFSADIYKRANRSLSLSKMTFTHQMIRIFFVEQLYRSFTILRGEKYHND